MSFESPKCHVCGADRPVSSRAIEGHCGVCGAILDTAPELVANPDESLRYIQKARNSGNAAEAYEYCCQAIRYDPTSAIAWAERFRISFWLNSELKGNTAKAIPLDEQLTLLNHALEAEDEEIQFQVAKILIHFYISESVIDQHIRLHPTDEPVYVVRLHEFVSNLPTAIQTHLKEELIYLTGESLNKSLSANLRTNLRRQNFLNLGACLSLPISKQGSRLYLRIYETLESLTDSEDQITRTGFMCLISSDKPDVAQENICFSKNRTSGPNYELSDWPVGVQIVSNRIPEKLLSTWLVHWFFGYQAFLGIHTKDLETENYTCLGSTEELTAALDAFARAIEVSFSA